MSYTDIIFLMAFKLTILLTYDKITTLL